MTSQKLLSTFQLRLTDEVRLSEDFPNYTSVELELAVKPEILDLFITTTGDLSVWASPKQLSIQIEKTVAQYHPELLEKTEVESILWDEVGNFNARLEILDNVAKYLDSSKKEAKVHISGLELKDKIELQFKAETEFLGKNYPAGTHVFPWDTLFLSKQVEYTFRSNKEKLSNKVELHFGPKGFSAGDTMRYSRTFTEVLTGESRGRHVHIVAPLPTEILKESPLREALKRIDYICRIEMLCNFMHILAGHEIQTIKHELTQMRMPDGRMKVLKYGTWFFGPMYIEIPTYIYDYLLSIGKDEKDKNLRNLAKRAFIGFRSSSKYQSTEKLYGLEFRDVDRRISTEDYQSILDAIQWSWMNNEFGIDDQYLDAWQEKLEASLPEHFEKAYISRDLKKNWKHDLDYPLGILAHSLVFNQSFTDLSRTSADPEIKARIQTFVGWRKGKTIAEIPDWLQNEALKVLFFDWQLVPWLISSPETIEKIKSEQKKAYNRLFKAIGSPRKVIHAQKGLPGIYKGIFKTEKQTRLVLKKFVKHSGLFDQLIKTLHLEVEPD